MAQVDYTPVFAAIAEGDLRMNLNGEERTVTFDDVEGEDGPKILEAAYKQLFKGDNGDSDSASGGRTKTPRDARILLVNDGEVVRSKDLPYSKRSQREAVVLSFRAQGSLLPGDTMVLVAVQDSQSQKIEIEGLTLDGFEALISR